MFLSQEDWIPPHNFWMGMDGKKKGDAMYEATTTRQRKITNICENIFFFFIPSNKEKKRMQRQTIAGIVLSCIFLLLLVMYLVSFRFFSKDVIIFTFCILQVVSLFFIFFASPSNENFYFEVSPERKKCLMEQVSLDSRHRSPGCCPKGTVGGILPEYKDWLTPEGENQNWKRTDNWTENPTNVAYVSQLPATELVTGKLQRKKKIIANH